MPVIDRIHSVEDARRYARLSTPRALFSYIDGGAEGELTMVENERAFQRLAFRPRAGLGLPTPRLETTVVGMPVSFPVLLAPCGLIRLMHPDGAIGVFRAAHRAGTIAALSTFAGTPPEEFAGEPGPRWFQLYAPDREAASELIGRAKAADFDALVVTMDSATAGKRERDAGSGAAAAMQLNARNAMRLAPQLVVRPRWLLRMAKTTLDTIRGSTLPGGGGAATSPLGPPRSVGTAGAPTLPTPGNLLRVSPFTWDDVKWMRDQWSGPLIVKSILSGEDAAAAVDAGADAVVVSNHGGRQLEGTPATMTILPEVVDAVGARTEVLVDSGVRRGGDVVKALAAGARAVLIGRPYCYGLAAAGEAGVHRVLEILRQDMARTMALMGCASVADLDPTWLRRP